MPPFFNDAIHLPPAAWIHLDADSSTPDLAATHAPDACELAAEIRSFLFQMQIIRLVHATNLIATRKSMNWTPIVTDHTLRGLVGACLSTGLPAEKEFFIL
jgi:hypothetical protein